VRKPGGHYRQCFSQLSVTHHAALARIDIAELINVFLNRRGIVSQNNKVHYLSARHPALIAVARRSRQIGESVKLISFSSIFPKFILNSMLR
jgi:hypothetical protein